MNSILFDEPFTTYEDGDQIEFEGKTFEFQDGVFKPVEADDQPLNKFGAPLGTLASIDGATSGRFGGRLVDATVQAHHAKPETYPLYGPDALVSAETLQQEVIEASRPEFYRGLEAGKSYTRDVLANGGTPRSPKNYLEISNPFDAGFEAALTIEQTGGTDSVGASAPEPGPEPEGFNADTDATMTVVGNGGETVATVPVSHLSFRREGDNVVLRFYDNPNGGFRVNIPAEEAVNFAEALIELGSSDEDKRFSATTQYGAGEKLSPVLIDVLGDRYDN